MPGRHYPRAPITEAIIDLRVQLPQGVDVERISQAFDREASRYPNKKVLAKAVGRVRLGAEMAASTSATQIGFVLTNADETLICQPTIEGFTLSKLTPYESWEPFRDEARRLWNIYREAIQPEAVRRLAVRYINRIDIPEPVGDLSSYLRTLPSIAPELPQVLDNFLMQLVIRQSDIESTMKLSEAVVESPKPETASVVLDIDIFRADNIPVDEAALWQIFEQLRARKNEVFEACITDRTRELIN